VPENPICRSAATAMFRMALSPSANRNSAVFPAKTHVTPSERSTRRSAASGMPSRMADAAADGMRQSYH
jgi:hypothetical protein